MPSRVEVTKHTSAKAYMAVSSSKGTERCMKTMGVQVGVLNWPLMRPTNSLTHERKFMYSSTSCREGMASWMRMTFSIHSGCWVRKTSKACSFCGMPLM